MEVISYPSKRNRAERKSVISLALMFDGYRRILL